MLPQTLHQEIIAHKRIIEAVSEKANALSQLSPNQSDIRHAITSVSDRYDQLVALSQQTIAKMETLLDIFQQFHDLQKSYQDYQKQQWDRLASYSDCTGNKVALQGRLAKLIQIQDGQSEGDHKLQILEEHVKQNSVNLPQRSLESMERDLSNLRYLT